MEKTRLRVDVCRNPQQQLNSISINAKYTHKKHPNNQKKDKSKNKKLYIYELRLPWRTKEYRTVLSSWSKIIASRQDIYDFPSIRPSMGESEVQTAITDIRRSSQVMSTFLGIQRC